jgi:hypothetical protein
MPGGLDLMFPPRPASLKNIVSLQIMLIERETKEPHLVYGNILITEGQDISSSISKGLVTEVFNESLALKRG